MSVVRILALVVSFALASQASAKDILCRELNHFVTGQLKESATPAPRHWAEIHFGVEADPFATWSMGCLHAEDLGSKRFCDWLLENAGGEFGDSNLKRRILDCLGYRFPSSEVTRWSVTDGHFQGKVRDGVWLTIEVTRAGLPVMESAIRFSIEFDDRSRVPSELGPIIPYGQSTKRADHP